MEVAAGQRGGEKEAGTQAAHHESVPGLRWHLWLPAHRPAARPLGHPGGAGAGPRPDAGARPGGLPAAALAAVHHTAGTGGPIPDLVARDFGAAAPGEKMVGDITYIPTWEGWLYLATVIDCATRKVAGWAMGDNYKTPLITAAIEMAARNLDLPADAIFHSDRGSNYTSGEFAAVLGRLGIRQSVGRTGICFDNALAESFNAALKVERVHRTVYPTRKKAREDIARYIEIRYNRARLHSALGYRTPQEAHDDYLNLQAAA